MPLSKGTNTFNQVYHDLQDGEWRYFTLPSVFKNARFLHKTDNRELYFIEDSPRNPTYKTYTITKSNDGNIIVVVKPQNGISQNVPGTFPDKFFEDNAPTREQVENTAKELTRKEEEDKRKLSKDDDDEPFDMSSMGGKKRFRRTKRSRKTKRKMSKKKRSKSKRKSSRRM